MALLCVGAVLYELEASVFLKTSLIVYCLGFPHLAYWYSSRMEKPRFREFNNYCFSGVVWGIFIAAMQFNLVPSVILISGLHAEVVGGWRLYLKSMGCLVMGIVIGGLTLGFEFQPVTSYTVMLASVPSMIVVSFTLGITAYNLNRSLIRQHRKTLQQSRIDGLSGLMNRDYFDIRAELEFHRCQRGGHISAFIMIDIDHFKQINDKHGHLAGDKIIQQMAALFVEEIRDIDFAARYGGEEFCLCLVDTDAAQASIVAERIRARVEVNCNEFTDQCNTISCGIAEYNTHYSDYQQWLHRADKALYRAKKLGRNRVEVAEPPSILDKNISRVAS